MDRYRFECVHSNDSGEIWEHDIDENGEWVKYSDVQDRIKELEELLKRKNSVLTQYDRDWEFIEENFSLLEPYLKAIKEKLNE
jgi:hypothetical protein